MSRALLLILTLCWGLPAWPECAARLQVPGSKLITPWLAVELAQGRQLQESIDVRVSNAQGCPALALGADVSVPPDNSSRARLRVAPNGAEIGSSPGASQPLLALSADADGNLAIDPVLEWSAQGQALAAGRQELRIRWRLYPADELLPQPLVEQETLLVAEVPAILEVELIAAGARVPLAGANAMLDFGEVASGSERSVDIEVRGNARAQLSITRPWGELRLRGRPDYTIPYSLLLDGRPAPADGMPQPLEASGDYSRTRLSVRLGDVERRAAGVYEDILTLVVAAE